MLLIIKHWKKSLVTINGQLKSEHRVAAGTRKFMNTTYTPNTQTPFHEGKCLILLHVIAKEGYFIIQNTHLEIGFSLVKSLFMHNQVTILLTKCFVGLF